MIELGIKASLSCKIYNRKEQGFPYSPKLNTGYGLPNCKQRKEMGI